MKSIAFFNNKGGVGKTTLLCNLASYLSKYKNKKVLVVDADPQCSATIYILNDEQITQLYSKINVPSINDLIQHLKKVRGGYIPIDQIPIQSKNDFGVSVLIGDTKLALAEDFLSKDWSDAIGGVHRGLMTTFVFKGLLDEIQDNYDYVFFDLGPSLGAINRSVLLACDYFVVPMSSDIFCLRAIDNIAQSLKGWSKGIYEGLIKYREVEGEPYLNVYNNISFLGYITQQYNSRRQNGNKRPVKAYDKIISRFPEEIKTKLSDFYPESRHSDLLLGEIPNWNSLIAFSQSANKPIFTLESRDGIIGSHIQKVKEFGNLMQTIAERIINLTEND